MIKGVAAQLSVYGGMVQPKRATQPGKSFRRRRLRVVEQHDKECWSVLSTRKFETNIYM